MSASPRLPMKSVALAVLVAVVATSASRCRAQYEEHCGPFCDSADYQFFEPVDLDLNCQPIRFDCGWTFSYEKNYWAITGERTIVGDTDADVISEIIFPGNTAVAENAAADFPSFLLPDGTIPQAVPGYTIQNGIQNAPPRAEFGWGDRYELAYVGEDGHGIMIGLMAGMKAQSEDIYGFAPIADDQATPFGFGSVHVNFFAPEGFLEGFRDYTSEQVFLDTDTDISGDGDDDDGFSAGVGPTETGPGDDGVADGIIDDILVNGTTFFVIDVNGDGDFELGEDAFYIDFGDLHLFNIRFEQIGVRSTSRLDGVELMRTHSLSNRHWMQKHQNQRLEIGYGARLVRFDDTFLFDGNTDIAGRMFSETESENQIVGPQVRVKWQRQDAKWNVSLDGRCLLGYNIQDISQLNGIGEEFAPGALNKPLIAQPTYSSYGKQEETFAPVVEFRAEVKYSITRSMSAALGYNAMFIDNISRSSQLVEYRLPDMGIGQGGKQDVFVNGLNMKLEFWY